MSNASAPSSTLINQRLGNGRFQVLNLLGSGGMADVYRAWDDEDSREVAIKFPKANLLADSNFALRFQREIKTMSRLRHPNIVPVLYSGKFNGLVYAVFPYLSGGSLKDRLKNQAFARGRVSPEQFRWLIEVGTALDYMHQNNLLHRDVKPDNIFFDAQGKAYLGDFGIVRALDPGPQNGNPTVLTSPNSVLGTVAYMAPEMIMGHTPYTGNIDQYSLAVTVYEALKGSRPFSGQPQQVMIQTCQTPPVPLQQSRPDLPPETSAAVQRGLAKSPRDRFPSCTAFAQAVISSINMPTAFTPTPVPPPPPSSHYSSETYPHRAAGTTWPNTPPPISAPKSMPWKAITIASSAVLGLGLIVGVLVLVLQQTRDPQRDPVDPNRINPFEGQPVIGEKRLKRNHTGYSFVHFGPNDDIKAVLNNNNVGQSRFFARVYDLKNSKSVTPPLHHTRWLYRGSFSPDASVAVTVSQDNTARIWNAKTGRSETPTLRHNDRVNDACFSPDGSLVVTASDDSTARIWNARNGNQLHILQHAGKVLTGSFSPDGKLILTASRDKTARLWYTDTGRAQGGIFRHNKDVMQAAFSTDGTMVATASADSDARIWSVKTGMALTRPLQHNGTIFFVEFSLDGSMLVSASIDDTARVWDAKTGNLLATVRHNKDIFHAAFSHDGTMIATASEDRTARIWDARTGKALTPSLNHFDVVNRVVFSPDGSYLITTCWDNTCWMWDVKNGKKIRSVFCSPN